MKLLDLLDTPPWDWPRNAGEMFRKVLVDRKANPAERLAAAEMAGDFTVINDVLSVALMKIVGDSEEPEELRATAAIAFGAALEQGFNEEFVDPDGVPISEETYNAIRGLLHDLYLDESVPTLVRRRILEASARAPDDWQLEAIQAAWSGGDRDWMLTAVFAMRYIQGFQSQILEALESGDPDIHFEAIEAAGQWQLADAGPHVLELIKNPQTPKEILLSAIGAAAAIDLEGSLDKLTELTESPDEEIAEAAQDAIDDAQMSAEIDEEEDEEGEPF